MPEGPLGSGSWRVNLDKEQSKKDRILNVNIY